MKLMKGLCCNVFLLAYIATCYSQSQNIKPCALVPTRVDCLKVHEVPRTPTPWVICGSGIKTTVEHLCGLRVKREAPKDVLLRKKSASQFLSPHRRTKRSFNAVEECCDEGCTLEELREYCPLI